MSNFLDTKYHISEYSQDCDQEVRNYFSTFKVWKNFFYSPEIIDHILRGFSDPTRSRLFLCRDDHNKIVATLGVFKWGKLPYYSINSYTGLFGQRVKEFKAANCALWTHVLKEMEKEKRHSFYWCIRNYPLADLVQKRTQPQLVRFVPYLKRYQFNIEEIVSPGEQSQFQVYREFNAMPGSTEAFVIKRASLKSEFFLELKNSKLSV